MRVIALAAIVCAALLLFGGLVKERTDPLRVTTISEPTLFTVIVTLNRVTEKYRWLSVHGCTADVTESGTFCNGYYEMESSRELHGRKQELFDWRRVPSGTLLLTAMAFDVEHKVLASGQTVVIRGR